MHILLISNYFEPDAGAAAIRLTRLMKILQKRGHQITVLTSLPHYPQGHIHDGYRGNWVVTENRDGMRVIQTWLFATQSAKISRKLVSQISFMLTASLRGIAIPKPDVILIEGQPMFTTLAGMFLARLKRVPYVLNISDLMPEPLVSTGVLTEQSRIYRSGRWVADVTYRRAKRITAMSPVWAQKIESYIGEGEKIDVIYNGVDLNLFRPQLDTAAFREKYQLPDQKIISSIGTFALQYDFDALWEVVKKLSSRNDVQIVVIGQGTQGEAVRQRLTGEEFSGIHWIDWLDKSEIAQAWNASYLNIWTMRPHDHYKGTIPAKLYEAMACGTPIAAAMEGVGADIVADSGIGITVPCGDIDGLVRAIERFLADENFRQQCSQSARQYAEENYDPEKVAIAYEKVLFSVIEKN